MKDAKVTVRESLGIGWIDALIGVWLVLSPFVLGFSHNTAGTANNICVGIALILFTVGASKNSLFKALIILAGSGWVYTSGFILGVSGPFLYGNLIVAILVIFITVASESPYPENVSRERIEGSRS